MVNSKLILAVAGAGKTYYIANQLNEFKKNLVITFTNQNVKNLEREIRSRFGYIPQQTLVMTFSSFIYGWLLKPVEPLLLIGNEKGLNSTGVDVFSTPEPNFKDGKYNPKYKKQDNPRHYIASNNKYYVSRMAKLFIKQPTKTKTLILSRLAKFCDALYVDEIQDFMAEDFDILVNLIKSSSITVIGVGDFYQHSVSKSDFQAVRPFRKAKKDISKEQYIALFGNKVEIDETTLKKSRRVPSLICDFITEKLGIEICSSSSVKGDLEVLNHEEDIKSIVNSSEVVKLVLRDAKKYDCVPINTWTYCKGDTYENTCIVLTKTFERIMDKDFSVMGLSSLQVHTLYVALTRATHKVYLVSHRNFKNAIKY